MSLRSIHLFVIAIVAFFSINASAYEGQTCWSQSDCGYAESCINNRCQLGGGYGQPQCRRDYDCGYGYNCDYSGRCVREGRPGDRCSSDSECGRGLECYKNRCYERGASCLPSGANCGRAATGGARCCSRTCVAVPGDGNNYCR